MLQISKYLVPVVLILFVAACDKKVVYNEYQSIPDSGWSSDSIQYFSFQIKDTSRLYNITFNFRHSSDYPYQNCWIFTKRIQPDSTVYNDTTQFFPADETGRWLGTGLGSVFNFPAEFKKNYRFQKPGIYQYQLRHGLRDSLLTGIIEIGLKISLADGEK
jgi:gliding motility-associated lipoprotein GldH